MIKSVRLDPSLGARLKEASRLTGEPESRIIRAAIAAECERLLGDRLDLRLADMIGCVSSGGGDSRDTGKQFAELMEEKHGRRR